MSRPIWRAVAGGLCLAACDALDVAESEAHRTTPPIRDVGVTMRALATPGPTRGPTYDWDWQRRVDATCPLFRGIPGKPECWWSGAITYLRLTSTGADFLLDVPRGEPVAVALRFCREMLPVARERSVAVVYQARTIARREGDDCVAVTHRRREPAEPQAAWSTAVGVWRH